MQRIEIGAGIGYGVDYQGYHHQAYVLIHGRLVISVRPLRALYRLKDISKIILS